MLTIALTVASLLTTQIAPVALADSVTRRPAAAATVDLPTAADHLDSARRALANGEFDVARREFVIAAALDRDEGKLPIDASFGLANVLYASSFNREAAITMDRLASEASAIGDYNTEARALLDAIWLNVDAGQRNQARNDALRLKDLIKEGKLSEATLKSVRERYR